MAKSSASGSGKSRMTLSSDPDHEIIVVPPLGQSGREQLLQECYDIRINVFHREQGYSLNAVFDELDEMAGQFLLRLLPSLQPVGTVRVTRASSGGAPYYKLSRLAVLKDFRNHHFGLELVLAVHKWVIDDSHLRGEHSAKVVCHSQTPVKAFYTKIGYTIEGNEFDEAGSPHQKMVAQLHLSP